MSTQLRLSLAPCVPTCEALIAEGDHAVLAAFSGDQRSGGPPAGSFARVHSRLADAAARGRKRGGLQAPRRPLYVNNINSQRLHDCFRTLYGQDDIELELADVLPAGKEGTLQLPHDVDVTEIFSTATSVDMQHLDLSPAHFEKFSDAVEMPVLTHVNLSHNVLGDAGSACFFAALVAAGCGVVHVSLASNHLGDAGASAIAQHLASLPRLTSLELCDNLVSERGSVALAEAVGGGCEALDEASQEEASPPAGRAAPHPLPMLSVDLSGNRSRESGAMRWAEVVSTHPHLQFLSLARNEVGRFSPEPFSALVYAAGAATSLSVLDLRENFPLDPEHPLVFGPPPVETVDDLLAELPSGEFDPGEVRQAVFIRRNRGGGAAAAEKKSGGHGSQPSQSQAASGAAGSSRGRR